ncbi:hypothetical protein pEaSNUABM22_00030 [Erwinia phage pEa_SNUABM_22]|uniref:Uncharacterized protein n=1 Tax=Erwinia phage pEa_SNUABM_22 TaxID=2869549 RepID=A0AAE9BUA7_9CAUD|nr:hypothetical protein MPK63_gp030 [Erwinia phage pEa_SNUABM_22]UAW96518.1 hypothetical protein pEaSNUABM22_00030 [Erwinia phage pEa_SNUABM_22]
MYLPLGDNASDAEARAYYQKQHERAEATMREIWALRGWTIRWEWHNGICDDCEFLFDETGKQLCPYHDAIPQESQVAYNLEKHRLNVTYTKKSVKLINKQDPNPVEGKADTLRQAYINWLLALEKQKAEEQKCATT